MGVRLRCDRLPNHSRHLFVVNGQLACYRVYTSTTAAEFSHNRQKNAICPVASAESRRRLRSASSADLIVPATRSTTMGAGRCCPNAGRPGNSLGQTVHTHCASVHQAAKLVAALLRAAGVTAGLAESNGSLPPAL